MSEKPKIFFNPADPFQIGALVGLLRGDVIDAVIVFWCLQQLAENKREVSPAIIVAIAACVKIASWRFY